MRLYQLAPIYTNSPHLPSILSTRNIIIYVYEFNAKFDTSEM